MSNTITDKARIDAVLSRGVEAIYPSKEKLAEQLASGTRLRLYCGMDPTAPVLHIGHAIQLRKLREFQDLGHEVIWLFGTFTAMIGDPTDKMAARKQLTQEEVKANVANYKKLASKILRFSGENPVKILRNDKWLAKLNFANIVDIASKFTVQQMMERDMFEKRWNEEKPIHLHEFMYPLMQGYDSVAMDVDLEIGGSDQTFNMLAGRTLQRAMKNREKSVLALKLLTNDEGKKMSKSEGGFIAINDTPEEMYGKLMSMNDSTIVPYFRLVTDLTEDEIVRIETSMKEGENPRQVKSVLAKTVTAMFHSKKAADKAAEAFEKQFRHKETPDNIPEHKVLESGEFILDVLLSANLIASKSEGRNIMKGGGIKLDGLPLTDITLKLFPEHVAGGKVLQRGSRHFVRLVA